MKQIIINERQVIKLIKRLRARKLFQKLLSNESEFINVNIY